ncbi:DUF262 domain-containing protein [Phycisphaera mikurensis]|uniref:GmrSD restriction endonucleases N-terminal domain-containing protein n=1 Tax=Phycisphaera mikurensis (strain NBRC 102666 / KCTC 22515 / FYK2301M01) TaxID=1142394 RepID=I0IJ49_PHYMF|nr:DUF262 domain-containing protein [Phycisphaera mikurensis]MBB6443134.1 hypothetical protein [Phycisphaera mikurensis]BAM05287.1 hypothetical protein PSMK_31280 [Phycisphaera mikurensis NBRC 102666]
MQQPEPQSRNLDSFLHEIDKGAIKIPLFQRDFVWERAKSAALLDSVLKGYPVGTFILWKTKERMRSVRDIGGVPLPELPEGETVEQVLDGQQRLTSLYAAVKGLSIQRGKRVDDFGEIVLDLDADPDGIQPLVLPRVPASDEQDETPDADRYAPVASLQDKKLFALLGSLDPARSERLLMLRDRLSKYRFSMIIVGEAPLSTATEIFTRINVTGKALTVFEIMAAKTYNEKTGFDLAERFDRFREDLDGVGYGLISGVSMLQLTSLLLTEHGSATREDILNLPPAGFPAAWERAVSAAEAAVDHFRQVMRVPVSRLLPYGSLIVPFGFFFAHHPANANGHERKALEEFFFRVALTGRYTSAVETKLASDARIIAMIARGEEPAFDRTFAAETSAASIERRGTFRTSGSYVKALLAVLAAQGPRSFSNDAAVTLGNDWLKQANSRNYHHFFPKAFLTKQGVARERANHTANITLVDDFLNKRVIRAQPPSEYLPRFREENPDLDATLRSHLIEPGPELSTDDYGRFFRRRCERLSKELAMRVPRRSIDDGLSGPRDADDVDPEDADA